MIDRDTDLTEPELTDADDDEGEALELTQVGSTPVDFASLGLAQLAYIREAIVDNEKVWCIFSAAGDPLGAARSFDQAWAAARQHHLQPLRVN